MKTMVKEPYVHHVPVLTGGVGYDNVYNLSAVTAYLQNLEEDRIYEIWIFYKILELLEPMRQMKVIAISL
jgi:hypothetical protein